MTAEDDDELRLVLQRLARRIRNNRAAGDINDTQLAVLFKLEIHGAATPSDLAAQEHITPPSMNKVVNGLEERGYVTRTRSADDARKVLIELTPRARDFIAETRRLRTAWFSQHLAALDPADRAVLRSALPVLRRLAES